MSDREYKISVHGCDDSTVFTMRLTDEQAESVYMVAKKCTETSTYGCMPVMEIKPLREFSENLA